MTFTFGIYPGALLGSDTGLTHPVHPDQPEQITAALRELQGGARTLLVRAYRPYAAGATADTPTTPDDPMRYLGEGRELDLVLQFREPTGELDGWLEYIRATVRTDGPHLASLQICEEPNLDMPNLDGGTPNVLQAIVQGVVAAKEEARACGHDILVGFNAVPDFGRASPTFWQDIGALADERFHRSLDYVGLDFFPDVFRPLPADQLPSAVAAVLTHFRDTSLRQAGIGASVPVHISENGWPTGPTRTEHRQAEVLEEVVRKVTALRESLNIGGYSYFDLRDANTSGTDLFDGFGLLRDDYSRKEAFGVYRGLIEELTV
ncbi:hypothetical protein AB0H73_18205 [Streptomyces olivoreticuli]